MDKALLFTLNIVNGVFFVDDFLGRLSFIVRQSVDDFNAYTFF
ncbi:hypothetical protein DSUL_140060 [Desulfovibrionales bacterium]